MVDMKGISNAISKIPKVKIKVSKKKQSKPKSITKPNKATITIKEKQAPSILGDPNRFFKHKEEDAEMQYFFR